MKRWILSILCAAVLACLCTACKKEENVMTPEEVSFLAVITEIDSGTMLVTPVEGSEELKSSDAFRVPIEHMPASPEPQVGDTVEIVYYGYILETYPATLEGIKSITVVDPVTEPEEALSDEEIQEPEAAETQPLAGGTAAEVSGPYGTLCINVPENWTWEACPVDSDKLMYGYYGIILRPTGAKEGQIELIYHDSFAVCGTGLESKDITLAGGPAMMGIYDRKPDWDFIIFRGANEGVVAQTKMCETWTDGMWAEALTILDSASFDADRKEGGIGQFCRESENDTIAVLMEVRHVTPTGATVRFHQYDNMDHGALIYGQGFYLERQTDSGWEKLPEVIDEWAFTEEGYPIPQGGEAEIDTQWEWLYGALGPGTYRICKSVWRGEAEYKLCAQFVLV